MSKELLNDLFIDVSAREISIALLENQQLVSLHKEKTDLKFAVGDIYLGKVKKIMPGLNAAFVDIGYEKDAFLHYLDLGPQFRSLQKYMSLALSRKGKLPAMAKFRREPDIDKDGKIADVLKSGQLVLVQVVKEPISTKGPRLSSELSLAGRNIVLIPFSDKVSISQKIDSADERNRLKRLLLSIKPRNYGIIVRTQAETKKVATFDTELRALVKKWESAFEKQFDDKAPRQVISELHRTYALLRDILDVSFNSIHVNDSSLYSEIRDYISTIAPEKQKIVKLYGESQPIFEKFGINKQIKGLFGRTVSFKNGAYLVIEHTEALHVIDVNSGNRSKNASDQESNALQVNLAAADEIARQLRLRDMGGIIVIDFIDMQQPEHKQELFDRLKEAMSCDKTKHNILPVSKFGLIQITRQRVRPEMTVDVSEKCPLCLGTGKTGPTVIFTDELKEKCKDVIEQYKLKNMTLQVHPFVAAYLSQGYRSLRKTWSRTLKCRISVQAATSNQFLEYRFLTTKGEEIPHEFTRHQGGLV